MRDIRGDLQERAKFFEQQMNAAQGQFEKQVEQMKREKDSRLAGFRAELNAVRSVLDIEQRRLSSAAAVPDPQSQQALRDFLIRKLRDAGPLTIEDLCGLAVHEGYFADGEGAHNGLHAILTHVVKIGQVQQLQNGKFAPAPATDTTMQRRAI